jgi:hypothetical protein
VWLPRVPAGRGGVQRCEGDVVTRVGIVAMEQVGAQLYGHLVMVVVVVVVVDTWGTLGAGGVRRPVSTVFTALRPVCVDGELPQTWARPVR